MMRFLEKILLRFAVYAYRSLEEERQQIIREDLARWEGWSPDNPTAFLESMLIKSQSFRAVMAFRLKGSKNKKARKAFALFLMAFPKAPGIELSGEIEGGLRIIHNCCVVKVEHAGKNLSIGPFVVIGKKRGASPVIGDNVTICANSTVVGGIHIGERALIGAGSLVYQDVPAGAIVGGNPARILKYRNAGA